MRKRCLYLLLAATGLCLGFALAGCSGTPADSGDGGGGQTPETPGMTEQVTDYMLDEERRYTGTLVDGQPSGEGVLEWVLTDCVYTGEFENGVYNGEGKFEWKSLGDTLEGTFENGAPVYGTYTYANTMHYTGEFNEAWAFHGQGTFDWNTYNADGSVAAYGWLYEGEFRNGSPAGCVGKTTFNQQGTGSGIYWFEGEMSGFPEVKRNQQGKGKIVFDDGSWYEGEVYYTQDGQWLRYGEGVQNFFNTTFTGASAGGSAADKIYCYVGSFDALTYSWMYGNGVMCFSDVSGQPTGYIKGTWNGLIRVGPYTAEWSDEVLPESWRGTQELSYTDTYSALFDGYMEMYGDTDMSDKLLMLGDSQFSREMFSQAEELFAEEFDAVNIAIGGTTSDWWEAKLDELVLSEPEYILVHVGGNDIRVGDSLAGAIADTKALMDGLSRKYPDAKLYYVSAIVGVFDYEQGFAQDEISINDAMKAYAQEGGYTYLDVFSVLYGETQTSIYEEGYGYLQPQYFVDDLHLTAAGYELWGEAIKSALLQSLE